MKKHFTVAQIKWIVIICLAVELLTHVDDIVRGFKNGWNSTQSVAAK